MLAKRNAKVPRCSSTFPSTRDILTGAQSPLAESEKQAHKIAESNDTGINLPGYAQLFYPALRKYHCTCNKSYSKEHPINLRHSGLL